MNAAPLPHDPVLVEVTRGGVVESFHRGAVAVVDADGAVRTALGDIERPIFPRSAVKVLQALPLVESGAAERFGLGDDELAVACSSHGGEEHHVRAAASMLAKAGLDASALECGAHWPYHDGALKALAAAGRTPGALHNNCSGKHAGFACLGCLMAAQTGRGDDVRAFLHGYVQPGHPVMQEVSAALQAATGWDLARSARGTDGCSIPTHAVPLRHLAHAFARVATGVGLRQGHARAARRLREAVARAPQMVGASGRFDVRVMERFGARVFCKGGAEAVHCAALPELGLGIAVKMDDGNNGRASEVVMAALLRALLPLDQADAGFLQALCDAPMVNWNGIEVGHLRSVAPLPAGS
jgi:L-asparaginase II